MFIEFDYLSYYVNYELLFYCLTFFNSSDQLFDFYIRSPVSKIFTLAFTTCSLQSQQFQIWNLSWNIHYGLGVSMLYCESFDSYMHQFHHSIKIDKEDKFYLTDDKDKYPILVYYL